MERKGQSQDSDKHVGGIMSCEKAGNGGGVGRGGCGKELLKLPLSLFVLMIPG